MEIVKKLLRESRGDQWSDGFQWLLWIFLTGLLPLWGTMLLLKLFSQAVSLSKLMGNGEFVLYAASFTGAAIYLVMRDFKTTLFPSRVSLMILLVATVTFSTLIFAGITSLAVVDKASETTVARLIDASFVEFMSWTLLIVSIGLGFIVVIGDNIRTNPDPTQSQKDQLDKLDRDFDKLGG